MFLKNLKLVNFRNFSEIHLEFTPLTVLVGNNAQGKSNLLEAIYFLATTKSPRAEKDSQLIKGGEEFARVEGEVENKIQNSKLKNQKDEAEELTKLEIVMQKNGGNGENNGLTKKVKINGIGRRTSDYLGHFVAVHFSPEDINLVSGPPALRRWHIDLTLAQVDRKYKLALNEYYAALTARNRLLKRIKEGLSKLNELDFWTEQLVGAGEIITQKRHDFFQNLNKQINSAFLEKLKFVYQENTISHDRIREYLPKEVAATATLIGPHRDDFIFKQDNRDLAYFPEEEVISSEGKELAHFGSRGEQRSAVLELKLTELKFISQIAGTIPVLLLDDIFSEFDAEHRNYVIQAVHGQQTIVSTVELTQIPSDFLKLAKIVKVEKGGIKN